MIFEYLDAMIDRIDRSLLFLEFETSNGNERTIRLFRLLIRFSGFCDVLFDFISLTSQLDVDREYIPCFIHSLIRSFGLCGLGGARGGY